MTTNQLAAVKRQSMIRNNRSVTGYRGVSRRGHECYEVRFRRDDGVHAVVGRYTSAKEAAGAYDRVAKSKFGARAVLNFPDYVDPNAIELERRVVRMLDFGKRGRCISHKTEQSPSLSDTPLQQETQLTELEGCFDDVVLIYGPAWFHIHVGA
jgi:hypothetical protein